jgi:hypothetical protein
MLTERKQRRRSRWLGVRIVTLLSLLLSTATVHGDSTGPPLTESDIVRLFAEGMPAQELVRLIRTRETLFDLSEEMQHEMNEAGLPGSVLEAMIRQQRLMHHRRSVLEQPDIDAETSPEVQARIRIQLNPDRLKPAQRRVRIYDQADPTQKRAWATGERRFIDLALFVACTRAEHVPDQWRYKTPLGSRIQAMPRHKMLSFADASGWVVAGLFAGRRSRNKTDSSQDAALDASQRDRLGYLELTLPTALDVDVDATEGHDLVLGLAVRDENGYVQAALGELSPTVDLHDGLELVGKIRAKSHILNGAQITLEAIRPDRSSVK